MSLALLLAAMSFLSAAESVLNEPVINTTCGEVLGTWSILFPGVAQFRGVPYAQPPVGREGRWRPPRRPVCPSGRFNATAEGNICYQFSSGAAHQSEDCLYLDVHTKNLPGTDQWRARGGTLLPVLIWIYGGSLVEGSVSSYGPIEIMTTLGDVVVMAMNYRLAVFGFLAAKELVPGDPRGTSGNYGLLDQQMAMQWAKDNIANFGGDPNRMTLIGQSSGGTSIFGHLAAPGSRGLFNGAISLSGSPNLTMGLNQAFAFHRHFVDTTNCSNSPDVLSCLYALTPQEIVAFTSASSPTWDPWNFFPRDPKGNNALGLPIVDGVTITMGLQDALHAGLVDVPLILQTEQDEDGGDSTFYNYTADEIREYFIKNFAPWGADTGDQIFNLYKEQASLPYGRGYYDLDADTGVTCGHVELARAAAAGFRSPVYLSVVVQGPNSAGFAPLAVHGWDFVAGFNLFPGFPTSEEKALGLLLRSQWLALATNGSLSGPSAFPPVNAAAGFPSNYITGLQGHTAGDVFAAENHRRQQCDALRKMGIDKRFWWVD